MKFRLYEKDGKEIQAIVDALPDDELDIIGSRVDAMMELHKHNPLIAPMCAFMLRHFDNPTVSMFDMDDDAVEAAEEFLRDMMVVAAKRERAIEIWKHKHSFDEVA